MRVATETVPGDGAAVRLVELLREDAGMPLRERRNGQRLYDTLAEEGSPGSYPTLQRAVRAWEVERGLPAPR